MNWIKCNKLFLSFFFFSLTYSLTFKLFIHSGFGLSLHQLRSFTNPDSTGFHESAISLTERIKLNGWSEWRFLPDGNLMVGLSSALYAIAGPNPEWLLIVNAAIHAAAGLILFWILSTLFDFLPSLIGSLLFVINPTALEWNANLLRDGPFILGNYLLLWAGIRNLERSVHSFPKSWLEATCGILGLLLISTTRPYWIYFASGLCLLMAIASAAYNSHRQGESLLVKPMEKKRAFLLSLAIFAFSLWLVFFLQNKNFAGIENPGTATTEESAKEKPGPHGWRSTPWLPCSIDALAHAISVRRDGMLAKPGNSGIFMDTRFNSALEIAQFLPQALLVGVLSPFPDLWQGQGSSQVYGVARKVLGAVTFLGWICLSGIILGVVQKRRLFPWWLLLLAGGAGCTIFGLIFTNVGTLVRVRYGFYMLLVALGTACWVEFLQSRVTTTTRLSG